MTKNYPKEIRKAGARAIIGAVLLSGTWMIQSCEQDVLEGQPTWLGNSIYERLEEDGNFTVTLQLINDLDQKNVLSQTGSKTLFAADDQAYEEFFRNNPWGVRNYKELTYAQKKLLLNSSMINNAYLIELLSNVSGNPPAEGQCMRRESAASVFDTISRIRPENMPNTPFWAKHRHKTNGIVLLRDNTTKPMIHFLPAYMQLNNITGNDLATLTNGESSTISDSWVNGKKVTEADIACKNGYIHKVDGVMTSSDNMAEIIGKHANMSTFNNLLNRFTAPYYDDAATREYNRLYNNSDSVFVLRYFSNTTNTGNYGAPASGELNTAPDGNMVDAQLLFDPGWNQYIYANTTGKDLHYDAGAVLVPNNAALDRWWNNDGKVLQDMYGKWENVPMKVLVKLLNINMISTFSETVPSKFDNIVDNTTKTSLGIKPADVDSCFMGCNGVVYLLNKVFSPADYSSVSFPALVNENTMSVIYWGISNLEFEPYLNSMDSYYSFIIPTNDAMLQYVDPCSYGDPNTILYQFYYDKETKSVKARRYNYDMQTQQIVPGDALPDASEEQVRDRLEDLLNNLIIVGNVEDGNIYHKTKGGSFIKVANAGQAGTMTITGGLQDELGRSIPVTTIYDQTETGNGKSYVVEQQMPLTSRKSAYSILGSKPEYKRFYELLSGSKLLASRSSGNSCVDQNITLFDAYNYTIYAPTNEAIEKMYADGTLPNWEDHDALTAKMFGGDANALKKAKTLIEDKINNFLRYHIQDNSIIIGAAPQDNVKYESFTINPATKRFYSLQVNSTDNSMSITDQMNNTRRVVTADGLYNNQGREYWVSNKDNSMRSEIYNASDIVVHQIDGVLLYNASQLTKWQDEVDSLKPETTNKARRK